MSAGSAFSSPAADPGMRLRSDWSGQWLWQRRVQWLRLAALPRAEEPEPATIALSGPGLCVAGLFRPRLRAGRKTIAACKRAKQAPRVVSVTSLHKAGTGGRYNGSFGYACIRLVTATALG